MTATTTIPPATASPEPRQDFHQGLYLRSLGVFSGVWSVLVLIVIATS